MGGVHHRYQEGTVGIRKKTSHTHFLQYVVKQGRRLTGNKQFIHYYIVKGQVGRKFVVQLRKGILIKWGQQNTSITDSNSIVEIGERTRL